MFFVMKVFVKIQLSSRKDDHQKLGKRKCHRAANVADVLLHLLLNAATCPAWCCTWHRCAGPPQSQHRGSPGSQGPSDNPSPWRKLACKETHPLFSKFGLGGQKHLDQKMGSFFQIQSHLSVLQWLYIYLVRCTVKSRWPPKILQQWGHDTFVRSSYFRKFIPFFGFLPKN